jgi:Xaa-Pro aminopeptidase
MSPRDEAPRDPLWPRATPAAAFRARRERLRRCFGGRAWFTSGLPRPRNYPAQLYPYRAESHFAYFLGPGPSGAVLVVGPAEETLYVPRPGAWDALWAGPTPSPEELSSALGLPVRFLDELAPDPEAATLPPQDAETARWLTSRLGREVAPSSCAALRGADEELADSVIALRLIQDDAAIGQMRQAAAVTAEAHARGMAVTQPGIYEARVRASMEAEATARGMALAYGSIVTTRGEVLHQEHSLNVMAAGDLLLADLGAETPDGWASDVTRTWPVSRKFSASQRALYEVVLRAQLAALAAVGPGVRYRRVHETAQRALTEGLRELGILRGSLDELLAHEAVAAFFPHGIGHLLGLDVHDLEDLGDRAGYAAGRVRSTSRGSRFLRLDRDLEPGMVVTIEPGYYRIDALLEDVAATEPWAHLIHRERLAEFSDVRGIRIEDDVLITQDGCEVLTAAIPKKAEDVEAAVGRDVL